MISCVIGEEEVVEEEIRVVEAFCHNGGQQKRTLAAATESNKFIPYQ